MFGFSAFSETAFGALPAASGADVTVAITGVSSGSPWGDSTWGSNVWGGAYDPVGSVSPTVSVQLSGVTATGTVGVVAPPLNGVTATGSVGTVTNGGITVALTGVSATGSVGIVFGTQESSGAGVVATGFVGYVTPAQSVSLSGVTGTFAQDTNYEFVQGYDSCD